MNSDSIQDLLLQAMEIISNSVVKENNNKDITIWNCYITDDSNRKDGEYGVTDGSINFKAYSQYTEYKKSDYVAVVVPQGDYNNTKYIVQKVAADGSRLPYASPLDNYVQVTENLLINFKTKTFNKTQKQVFLETLDLTTQGTPKDTDKKNIYDTLIFSCDFKTYLSNSKKVKGKYGLIFTLNYRNEIGYPLQETITFDSTQFYGNPFNFVLPSTQSQGFALNETNSLTSISIEFFQDLTLDESLNENLPIIELLNLNIGLGVNIAKNPDNTLKIYTSNGFDYDKNNNTKDISLFWYNKDENNKYIGFEDGNFSSTYSEEKYVEEKRKYELYDIIVDKKNHPLSQNGMDLAVDVARLEDVSKLMLQDFVGLKTIVDQFNKILAYPLSELYVDEEKTKTGKDFMDILCGNAEQNNSLELCYTKVKTACEGIVTNFNEVLFGTVSSNNFKGYDSPLSELKTTLSDILPFYGNNFISSKIAQDMKEFYPEYYEIYSEYCKKIQRYKNILSVTYYNKIKEIIGGNGEFGERLEDWNSGQVYQKVAFSEEPYKNYYCIYWYKDSPYHEDLILGKGWERLEDYDNYGKNKAFKYPLDVLGSQRLRAVLFLNHQQYNSNILTFNLVTSDGSIIDPNAALSIKHGENSLSSYQFYDDNNYIMKISDTKVKRVLYPSLSSSIGQTLNDFSGGEIYWFLPKNKTMLKYSEENENSMEYSFYEEAENYCFYKKLPSSASLTLEDFSFVYLIDEYYDKHYSNNMIQCRIIKEFQEYKTSIPITFSSLGGNNSEYNLVVTPYKNSSRALNYIEDPNNPDGIQFLVRLFDSAGTEIPLELEENPYDNELSNGSSYDKLSDESLYGELSYKFETFSGSEFPPSPMFNTKNLGQVLVLEEVTRATYGILHLQAVIYVNKVKTIAIKKDYSIPFTTTKHSYVDGMFSIIYSCFGNNPRYYKDPFKFYNGKTGKEEEVTWSISVISSSGNEQVPEFKDNILVPKNSWIKTYTDEEEPTEVLTQIVAQATLGEEIVWYQPIIIESEIQSYRLLEGWDGRFQINEDGGYILSNMLVAGTKDEKNNFTGVTLGNMEILERDFEEIKEESESNTPATQEESQSEPILKSGMFGFHKGESSFGFDTDGTAFIGKNGKGRIKFDGNRGIIDMGTIKINSLPDEKKEESYFEIKKEIEIEEGQSVLKNIFQVTSEKAQIGDETLNSGVLKINMPTIVKGDSQVQSEEETMVIEDTSNNSMQDLCYFEYDSFNEVKNFDHGSLENDFYLGRGGLSLYSKPNEYFQYWSKMTSNGLETKEYRRDTIPYGIRYSADGMAFFDMEKEPRTRKGEIKFNLEKINNNTESYLSIGKFSQIKFNSPVRFRDKIILDSEDSDQFIFDFNKPAIFNNNITFTERNIEVEDIWYTTTFEGRALFHRQGVTFLKHNGKEEENTIDFQAKSIFKNNVIFGEEKSENSEASIEFNTTTDFIQQARFIGDSKPIFASETTFEDNVIFKLDEGQKTKVISEKVVEFYNNVQFGKEDNEPGPYTQFYIPVYFDSQTLFNSISTFAVGSQPQFQDTATFNSLVFFNGVTQFDNATTFNNSVTFNQDETSQITTTFNQTAKFNASVTFDDEDRKGYNVIFDVSTYFYGETGFSSQVYFGEKSAPIFDDKVTFKNQVDFTRSDQNSSVNFSLPVIFNKTAQFKEKIIFGDSLNSDNNSTNIIFNKASRFIQTVSFENVAYFYNSTYFLKDVSFSDLTYFSNNVSFSKQVTFKREATDTTSTAEFSLPVNFNSSSTFKGTVKFGENAPSSNQIIFNASAVFNQSPNFNAIVDFTKNVTFSNYVNFSKLPTFQDGGSPETFATQTWVEDKGYLTQNTADTLYLKTDSLSGYATQTWVWQNYTNYYSEFLPAIEELKTKIEELETTIGNLETTIGNLETKMGELETKIEGEKGE